MAKISVVVPVYNVEEYLHRCLGSILSQTFADFELVLVDDGSPDNCGAICDEYAERDERIHVIHKQNGGLSDARNAGIDWAFEHSDSEWLTFIDSDDWVHPQYLEALLNAANEHAALISVCGIERVTELRPAEKLDSAATVKLSVDDYFDASNSITSHFSACAKLYKKSLFAGIRYPVGKLHEDLYVTPKVMIDAGAAAIVRAPLYSYFMSDSSIMRGNWSEKRCNDELEASEAFIKLAKEKNLTKAYNFIVNRHAETMQSHLMRIDRIGGKQHCAARKQLKKELKAFLRENRRVLRDTDLWLRFFPSSKLFVYRFVSRHPKLKLIRKPFAALRAGKNR